MPFVIGLAIGVAAGFYWGASFILSSDDEDS